jgi:hypothetical protein
MGLLLQPIVTGLNYSEAKPQFALWRLYASINLFLEERALYCVAIVRVLFQKLIFRQCHWSLKDEEFSHSHKCD